MTVISFLVIIIVITLLLAFVLGIIGLCMFGSFEDCKKSKLFNFNDEKQFTLIRQIYGVCGLSATIMIMCAACLFFWLITLC